VLVIVTALLDALDGGLARYTNRVTPFGAFLDSSLDRYAEAALYGGLLWWYIQQGAHIEAMLVYAAIVGSIMVSYTRARAEGLGVECKVGLLTRFERIALLVLALLFTSSSGCFRQPDRVSAYVACLPPDATDSLSGYEKKWQTDHLLLSLRLMGFILHFPRVIGPKPGCSSSAFSSSARASSIRPRALSATAR